jgi:hypothetical protein
MMTRTSLTHLVFIFPLFHLIKSVYKNVRSIFFCINKETNEKKLKYEVIQVKQRRDRYDDGDGSQIFESVLLSAYIPADSFFYSVQPQIY